MHPRHVRDRAMALLGQGWSLNRTSAALGVSRAAVREWRDHGVTPRSPGGHALCPVCEGGPAPPPAAYAALLGFYLGDGCLSRNRTSHVLRVSCDRTYPGIIDDVGALVATVHPGGRATHARAPGVIVVQNGWKHWPCLFPQHGPGRKHERRLELADWQQEIVAAHPGDFLRGLFHSDGCRTNNWAQRTVAGETRRHDYPRWQFVNLSPDIMSWCCEALDRVGVPWRRSNHKTVSVSSRAGVAALDAIVGLKS